MAGDLSDPHGTHRVCAEAIFRALQADRGRRRAAGPRCCCIAGPGRNGRRTRSTSPCRSARATWKRKKAAIFRHESQKDSALFPGPDDPREFWQRAEDRNRHTADLYNQLGLPEYYALEGFVRWNGEPL